MLEQSAPIVQFPYLSWPEVYLTDGDDEDLSSCQSGSLIPFAADVGYWQRTAARLAGHSENVPYTKALCPDIGSFGLRPCRPAPEPSASSLQGHCSETKS